MIRTLLTRLLCVTPLAVLPLAAAAQDWALEGIDPIGYTADGAALPGRSDIATTWRGKSWHFVTEENRDTFESNPRAYAPGLDGLCVVALSEGRSEPGNPRFFVVIGQRTYFVRSARARDMLQREPQKILMGAKAHWAQMNP